MSKSKLRTCTAQHQAPAYGWRGGVFAALFALTPACDGSGGDVTQLHQESPDTELAALGGAGASPLSLAAQTPIVFCSDRAEENVTDLYVMAADGSGVQRVTREGGFFGPDWSPEGDSIAFRRNAAGENSEVGLVAPDGSPAVFLTEGESPELWNQPVRWSADGLRLAFASFRVPGELTVWIISRYGGQAERLLPSIEGNQDAAAWSRTDPSRIVYTEYNGRSNEDLWLAETATSSQPVNLTQGRVYAPTFPQWSPDGSRIAFSGFARLADGSIEGFGSHGDGGFTPPDTEIFMLDVESQELTRLTDNTGEDTSPVWAPGGNSLLFSSDRDGDPDIWFVPLDAPELAQNLIDDNDAPHTDLAPAWYWGPR